MVGAALDAWMMIPGWTRGVTTPQSSGLKLEVIVDGDGHIDGFSPEGKVTLTIKFKVTVTSSEGLDVEIDTKSTEVRTIKLLKKDK